MRLRSILTSVRPGLTKNLQFLFSEYKYDPLPSPSCIRLLEIVPSVKNGILECSLRAFELRDAPPFQALSYTWGSPVLPISRLSPATSRTRRARLSSSTALEDDPISPLYGHTDNYALSRRHSIICDGQIMKVTANLKDALRMLAGPAISQQPGPRPRYYWADALCVNQQNIFERNEQVAKMAEIFKKAWGVVVWLGKEDEYTADALGAIDKVSAIPEASWTLIPYTSFYEPSQSQHYSRSNVSYQNWLGLIALINRPWFKRAWVVQEIGFSRAASVVCGSKIFSWDKLSKTLSFIKATKFYHHLDTEKLKHIQTLRKNPGKYKRLLQSKLDVGVGPLYLNTTRLKVQGSVYSEALDCTPMPPLRMLLDTHRFSKSTDPRDKIYAFLGLANRQMAPFRNQSYAITPNYNLGVQEVYTEAARALLASYRNLSLLSHVEDASRRQIQNLPSWVPDYSVELDPYPLRYRGPSFWKASGKLGWEPNFLTMANGELDVQGYQLDVIDQTSILHDEQEDPSASWASIVKLALSLDLPYPNPGKSKTSPGRVEVLWRTLTTDIYNKIYPAPPTTGQLFIDYVLNLQIRYRLMPWSSRDEFQPHHSPLSESIYPEWRTLLQLEPPDSHFCIGKYRKRLTTVVESMFNGSYSPIGLAQLQHDMNQGAGKLRRLFKTQGGYLGTGARSLRRGDEVWILNGAGVPFVLRPKPNRRYELVGEAFVYGIMHGEIYQLSLLRRQVTLE